MRARVNNVWQCTPVMCSCVHDNLDLHSTSQNARAAIFPLLLCTCTCTSCSVYMYVYTCACTSPSLQVCNHPDLFERRDVVSPLCLAVPCPTIPRLVYHQIYRLNTHRHRYMYMYMYIHVHCTSTTFTDMYHATILMEALDVQSNCSD